jgi:hypothetical protein
MTTARGIKRNIERKKNYKRGRFNLRKVKYNLF